MIEAHSVRIFGVSIWQAVITIQVTLDIAVCHSR